MNRAPKTNRRESLVKAACNAYLDMRRDFFSWTQNTSAGIAPSGIFMRSNMRGVADRIGLQAPTGRFVAVEYKRERGGVHNDDQKRFMRNVRAHGGVYLLVRSVEELAEGLGSENAHVVTERPLRVIAR